MAKNHASGLVRFQMGSWLPGIKDISGGGAVGQRVCQLGFSLKSTFTVMLQMARTLGEK